MVFDRGSFLEFREDEMFSVLQRAVKADSSNSCYETSFIPPQTASTVVVPTQYAPMAAYGGVSQYNNGSTHWIDIYYSSTHKANLRGTYIIMRYQPYQARSITTPGFWGCPINPGAAGNGLNINTGYSIPWHPAYWFQNIYLFSGPQNSLVEQYVFSFPRFGDLCAARALLEYKRDALENSTMFTPCIESSFDDVTLSPESVQRAQLWLCGQSSPSGDNAARGGSIATVAAANNVSIESIEKCIPLSDLLASCCNPGYFVNSPKIRFQFTLTNMDQIAFCSAAPAGAVYGQGSQLAARATYNGAAIGNCSPVYVPVTDFRLMADATRLTPPQTQETAIEHKEGIPINVPYAEYYPIPSVQSQQIVCTGQSNVFTVILGFDAYLAAAQLRGTAGPVQNYSQKDSGALTTIALLYGTDQTTKQPISQTVPTNPANLTFVSNNGAAYALYRKAAGSDRSNLLAPAIPSQRYFVYNYYFLPLYPSHLLHLTADARDIRIDNTGSIARTICTFIKRFNGVQIQSNGECDKVV